MAHTADEAAERTVGPGPVAAEALPARLTHAATRTLLTTRGLPDDGGAPGLSFETDPAELLRPLADLPDGPSAGADHLLALGRVGRHRLVLDGGTGRIALAVTTRGNAPRVLLDVVATDLSVLHAQVAELAALRAGAADPAALGGRRGPEAVEEVRAAALGRMREADPSVFTPDGDAPYWSAAVLLESLRWAAHPGAGGDDRDAAGSGGGGLAHDVTPALLAGLGPVHPVAEADLPEALSHVPTRRLLTRLGLPRTGLLRGDADRPLATLAERWPWYAEEVGDEDDPGCLDRVYLGETAYDCGVLLDGRTGRLSVTVGDGDDGWPAPALHTDLSACYLALWVLERLRAEARRWTGLHRPADWRVLDHVDLLAEGARDLLADLDPVTFADGTGLWASLADDGHMGGLLG